MTYSALKKLPKESQPNLTELIRLDTISNDAINVVWCEIYERVKLYYKWVKRKSGMDDVYNFNDKDKLSLIHNDLDKYMKHLKRDLESIKTILKTISANQTDSHQILMNLLN